MMFDMGVPLWVYPILVWTMIWKGIGAWQSARKGQMIWFVAFFIFNTVGILPIIYLTWFQQDWNKGVPEKWRFGFGKKGLKKVGLKRTGQGKGSKKSKGK